MLNVQVDLDRVRANARRIRQQTGVPLHAVIKADAYGLGAAAVAGALANVVDGFCTFTLDEAIAIDLWKRTGKPALALGPAEADRLAEYLAHHVRPTVFDARTAAALRDAYPVLCLDTGMQRFACPLEQAADVVAAGNIGEAFTHAIGLEHVQALKDWAATIDRKVTLHAASTALLAEPAAWLDGTRPGLALYHDAVRIRARLIETRRSQGPVGYTGFSAEHHGVIPVGYNRGLRRGPCRINGQPHRIVEVGMQTAFVEVSPDERVGDEVILMDERLSPAEVARAWNSSPQETIVALCRTAEKTYIP